MPPIGIVIVLPIGWESVPQNPGLPGFGYHNPDLPDGVGFEAAYYYLQASVDPYLT